MGSAQETGQNAELVILDNRCRNPVAQKSLCLSERQDSTVQYRITIRSNICLDCCIGTASQMQHSVSTCLGVYREATDLHALQVHEPLGQIAEKWTELEWQALWYSGAFGTTFRSTDGALIEIIQFGFWNRESGPDFVYAAIRIDGNRTCEGDVEWDMHVADWERHGHSQNSAFVRLLGETRVNVILANVIYPMLTSSHQGDWKAHKKILAELGNRPFSDCLREIVS